jgi:hypothetical protein
VAYVQPVAAHPDRQEGLLLRGENGRWYVWTGDQPGAAPEEIDEATARWLIDGGQLLPFPADGPWFHVDDLPLVALPHPSRLP